jgi:hypothetical protein
MVRIFICLTFLLSLSALQAQNLFNKKYFDANMLPTRAEDFTLVADDVLVVGNVNFSAVGFLNLLDSNGVMLSSRRYSTDQSLKITKLVPLADSTFLVVGEVVLPQNQQQNALCMRLNSQGDTIWTRVYNSPLSENVLAKDAIQLSDSSFLIVGNAGNSGFAMNIDGNGNVIWSELVSAGSIGTTTEFRAIDRLQQNAVVIVGGYAVSGPVSNGIIMRIDTLGAVSQLNTSTTQSNFGDVKTLNNEIYVFDEYNAALIKLDSLLNVQWANTNTNCFLEFEGNDYALNEDNTGKILLTTNDGFQGYVLQIEPTGSVFQVTSIVGKSINSHFKVDSTLVVLGNGPVYGVKSSLVITPHYGLMYGNSTECAYSLSPWVIAQNYSFNPVIPVVSGSLVAENRPIFVEQIGMNSEIGCIDFLGGMVEFAEGDLFSVQPNPSNGLINLQIASPEHNEIRIYTSTGKLCLTRYTSASSLDIDLTHFASGVYYIQLGEQVKRVILNN